MFNSRRYGKFKITETIVRENPKLVKTIMGKCIVLRCEHVLAPQPMFTFEAICDDFEELSAAELMPTYSWVIDQDQDGVCTVNRAERLTNAPPLDIAETLKEVPYDWDEFFTHTFFIVLAIVSIGRFF